MLTIFLTTLKDRKISVLVYIIAAVLLMWMYVALFPSFADQADELGTLFESYPEGLLEAFGIEHTADIFSKLENFLSTEQYSFVWPIMALFMLAALASSSIAGEVEKGTAEILLSRPVSRLSIFFAKYLAGITILAIFVVISNYSVIPLAALHGVDIQLAHYGTISVIGFLFGLAALSLAFLFSTLFSEKGKANFFTGGIIVGMYVLQILSNISETFEWTQYLSFFYYFDANAALIDNSLSGLAVVVLLGFSVVATAIAAWHWMKRDIAI